MATMDLYQPLNTGRREIRLLKLLPTQDDDDYITCDLEVVSLDDDVEYEALSYCWGSVSDQREILLAGLQRKVTSTLFQALKDLRYHHDVRVIWVDAVCIDQTNLKERSSQVTMMGDIYRTASTVLIELDPIDEFYEDIFTYGKDLDIHWTSSPEYLLRLGLMGSWSTRIWTLQEAVLGRKLVFHIGTRSFSEKDLDLYLDSLSIHFFRETSCCMKVLTSGNVSQYLGGTSWAQEPILPYVQLLESRKSNKSSDLLDLIMNHNNRDATDLRDKIFGVTGMASNVPDDFVRYDLPLRDCIIHCARRIIQHSNSLEIIRYVIHPTSRDLVKEDDGTDSEQRGETRTRVRIAGLPSWCPDWSQSWSRPTVNKLWYYRNMVNRRGFRAGGPTLSAISLPTETRLMVTGVHCDTISRIGPCTDWQFFWEPKTLRQWCHMAANSSVHNAICDGCEKIIFGIRHKCIECDNFDLCTRCVASSQQTHPGHEFDTIRIAPPQPGVTDADIYDSAVGLEHLNQVPEITITEESTENEVRHKINITGSSWEVLSQIGYPFHASNNLQDAFRSTLLNLPGKEDTVADPNSEALLAVEAAFHEFWCLKVEERPFVTLQPREGLSGEKAAEFMNAVTDDEVQNMKDCVVIAGERRQLFVSDKGYIGLAPVGSQVGDRICVIHGMGMPFIIRDFDLSKAGSGVDGTQDFTLVGEAYVHGLMNGEAVISAAKGDLNTTQLTFH